MADYGSGKYVEISRGILSFGTKTGSTKTSFGTIQCVNNSAGMGITSNIQYLELNGLDQLSIMGKRGYTGVIPMMTYFNPNLNPMAIFDSDEPLDYGDITFTSYRFVCGIMVGVA